MDPGEFGATVGAALWRIQRENPARHLECAHLQCEALLAEDLIAVSIRLATPPPSDRLEFRIRARNLYMWSRGAYGAETGDFYRSFYDLLRRVNDGSQFYDRWYRSRCAMLEAFNEDRNSPTAREHYLTCAYLEGAIQRDFPEACRQMVEDIRRDGRYREAYAFLRARDEERYEARCREAETAITIANLAYEIERHDLRTQTRYLNEAIWTTPANFRVRVQGGGGGGGTTDFVSAMWATQAEANKRAKDLLLEHLSPAQKEQMEKHNYFEVTGNKTGTTYRIREGSSINIDVLDSKGNVQKRLCFAPTGAPYVGDIMLAQKVMLELAEDEALRVAHPWAPHDVGAIVAGTATAPYVVVAGTGGGGGVLDPNRLGGLAADRILVDDPYAAGNCESPRQNNNLWTWNAIRSITCWTW